MGVTTSLRREFRNTLFPHFERLGFTRDMSKQPQFTVFRRQTGQTVQVFDIQWDKHGKPRFVVNFGDAPASGVVRNGKHLAAQQIEVFDCKPMLRLQRKRGGSMSCWFQLRRPVLQQLISMRREYTPEEVSAQVLELFTEVEQWWSARTKGNHVHSLGTDA